MSEIEKMYKNIGILPRRKCEFYEDCPLGFAHSCDDCNIEFRESSSSYPPFTAEKQIELIKLFSNSYNISINKDNNIFKLLFINKDGIHNFYTSGVDFEEQLALFVISRYKNKILSLKEKQQIKEILE